MPCLPLSDFLFSGARGTGLNKILKNVTLASNPFRISYYGKEIVITRYNYFKKLKKNHLAKIQV
jgi:thiamine pyrophosphokinase